MRASIGERLLILPPARAMLIRLAFLCVLPLVLSTSAFTQSRHSSAPPGSTLWGHNGSVVYLVANGSSREFYYEEPRSGMIEAGARPGSLLFRGNAIDGRYVGTAYIFNSRCGPIPYEVSGPILDNYERVVLRGNAPRVGSHCRVKGYSNDTIEFTLLKPGETATPGFPTDPQIGQCWGILHQDTEGMRFGGGRGEGEGICVINNAEENKVLAICSVGHYCKVTGIVDSCKDSGECSEITDITAVSSK